MPKQPARVHAAKTITMQDPATRMHCRILDKVLKGADDKARLRGVLRQNVLELQTQPHRDTLVRRLFSRSDIAMERRRLRYALFEAANNVTPARLKKLGSPGRRAQRVLRNASGLDLGLDVRAGQVRSATALLAGTRKKRAMVGSPVRLRSALLARTGATTVASADGVRRAQLRKFCVDSANADTLAKQLMRTGDHPVSIACSISIFRAAALNFIFENMKAGKRAPQAVAAQVGKRFDNELLRLFIARWRQAVAEGKIARNGWPWFDAVDWLVTALHGARPTSPGATRAPKSVRVRSPAASPSARAASGAGLPPQRGARRISLRTQSQLQSPTRLADAPAPQDDAARAVAPFTETPSAPSSPSPAQPTGGDPLSPSTTLARTGTLLEIAMHLSRQNSAASGNCEADSRLLPGADGDALPEHRQ